MGKLCKIEPSHNDTYIVTVAGGRASYRVREPRIEYQMSSFGGGWKKVLTGIIGSGTQFVLNLGRVSIKEYTERIRPSLMRWKGQWCSIMSRASRMAVTYLKELTSLEEVLDAV